MSYKVVILKSAQHDLKDLRDYIAGTFSHATWLMTSGRLQAALRTLQASPLAGGIPAEIEMLNLAGFRQVVVGKNRIIYEVRLDTIYVHVVTDGRRDMTALLTRRLMRGQ
jgi:toxin ParE1/3/4